MAVKALTAGAACLALLLLQAPFARGQSITTEAALSAGSSTDDVQAGAVQLRAFGELKNGVRFFGEAAWAASSDTGNDAFGAAYPYLNNVQVIEAYGERIFRPSDAVLDIRAGRFRTPFGIYNASDHAYMGFLRSPLVRYLAYESSLSNNFLEHGADVVVGVPRLTFETALGAPADVGKATRASGLDTLFRVQGSYGPFIVGVSHLQNHASGTPEYSSGSSSFSATATGIDVRWMQSGVQLRGEWISGKPTEDATNNGWYVDALIHRVGMGPVTAVARIEQLSVTDEGEDTDQGRQTIGSRVRVLEGLSLNVDVVHRSGEFPTKFHGTALDLGITWTLRHQ